MKQELGETVDAIIEDDNKKIQEILNANKHLKEKYWIVLFVKPAKGHYKGKPALIKVIKPYKVKPKPQVGMIVGEVDPKGTINWDINMPQAPFDFDKLSNIHPTKQKDEVVVETSSIPEAYITK